MKNKALLKQLAQWHEKDEFQKIVNTILAIPEEERDYELTGQLARALNNLGDYETAVEILLSAEEMGVKDALWHYRLGYAYYYSNMFEQAKAEFEQVLELTPEDEEAKMFLEWCEEELSPTVVTDKLNTRLMAAEAMMVGGTFRERADAFWEWFTQHEPKLAEMIEKRGEIDLEKMVEFIAEGVRLISDEVNFNVGGDYEFTFAVEGHSYLFYLLPWLVARMPKQFYGKWHFFPYMQGTHGESFGFQMYDKNIPLEEVMVGLHYDEEQNCFNVRFYQEKLCSLSEDQCYNAFYIMMELAIGEGLSRIYINNVEKADELEKGMFPLTKLESCMSVALEEANQELLNRPDERYTVYKMDFDEVKDLRYDMVIGNTCFTELIRDYFNEETTSADNLEVCGAKAVFLVIPIGDTDRSELLKLRYEIEDRLVVEVLGERGSGQEIGILLGGVAGRDYLYVDMLLYDTPAFIASAGELLMQFPYPFYLAEFRPESRLVAIAGVEADIPAIPTKPSELARQMMDYMDCSCDWFAPMADAQSLDKAYFVAREAGKQEEYIPVLVKVSKTLLDTLKMNMGMTEEEGSSLEQVRVYRRQMLEATNSPDVIAYFREKIAGLKAIWKEKGRKEKEIMGKMKEGKPNNDLANYWNYNTRLTDEILLVRVPVKEPWQLFGWLSTGNWGESAMTWMAIAKYWFENYGAVLATITNDELEFCLPEPIKEDTVAMKLAIEQYALCPDCVDQSNANDTIGKRADALRQSTVWSFWWG